MKTTGLDEARIAHLLDDTYEAAVDAGRWPALLQRLADRLNPWSHAILRTTKMPRERHARR